MIFRPANNLIGQNGSVSHYTYMDLVHMTRLKFVTANAIKSVVGDVMFVDDDVMSIPWQRLAGLAPALAGCQRMRLHMPCGTLSSSLYLWHGVCQ